MVTYFCRGKHTFPPKSEKTDVSLHILQFSLMSNLIDGSKIFNFIFKISFCIQSCVLSLLVEYIKEKGDLFK